MNCSGFFLTIKKRLLRITNIKIIMAKTKEMQIARVVIFVETKEGEVRQVITTPGVKLMAMNFIAQQTDGGVLMLGQEPENVEFTDLRNKEIDENKG